MIIQLIIAAALTLIAMRWALSEVRKPSRWLGRLVLWAMNRSHFALTDWGLEHVRIESHFTILDVGCGGGRTVQKLAEVAAEGKVYGVDYADGSVAASTAQNARLIQAGRVEIRQASVSELPFADDTFDLVTAVETQYYWPDLVRDMREVLRVLKPGGTLAVIAESYRGGRFDRLQQPVMRLLNSSHLSAEEHRELFATAGYTDVHVFEARGRGWICITGKKRS